MALEGTLDTFDLSDVVVLVGGTGKSGTLRVNGDHSRGELDFVDGHLCGIATDRPDGGQPVVALFELLRNVSGSYTFDTARPASADSGTAVDVNRILAEAQTLMGEWVELMQHVPGEGAWVAPVPTLSTDTVTFDQGDWATLVAVGKGSVVADIADQLGFGEFEACRAVKRLLDLGCVQVTAEPSPGDTTGTAPGPVYEQPAETVSASFGAGTTSGSDPSASAVNSTGGDGPAMWATGPVDDIADAEIVEDTHEEAGSARAALADAVAELDSLGSFQVAEPGPVMPAPEPTEPATGPVEPVGDTPEPRATAFQRFLQGAREGDR